MLVEGFVGGEGGVDGEVLGGELSAGLAEAGTHVGVGGEAFYGVGEGDDVVGGDEESGLVTLDGVTRVRHVRAHDGEGGGHGFDDGKGHAFPAAGGDEHIGGAEDVGYVADVAQDVARISPDAWIIQAGNPVSAGTTMMHRETGVKVCGLCHGHYGYRRVASAIGLDPDKVTFYLQSAVPEPLQYSF